MSMRLDNSDLNSALQQAALSPIERELAWLNVEVRSKRSSRLMQFIAAIFGIFGYDFMGRCWTTIGRRIIYAPDWVDLSNLDRHATIIRHELVHIGQARSWPILWQISYLLLPLPIFFAYFRWRSERVAYLVDIRAGKPIEDVVSALWGVYGFCWPRPWMRKWFWRQVGG